MLGALSGDPQGQVILERRRIINLFYSIIDMKQRNDLVQLLLWNMDFSLYARLSDSNSVTDLEQGRPFASNAIQSINFLS